MNALKSTLAWIWEAWGDPSNKNRIIVLLVLMCAFGMISPERATALRDLVLSLAL